MLWNSNAQAARQAGSRGPGWKEGNLATLKKDEWNVLVRLIQTGHLSGL
jgi:hypothetical protein